MHACMLSHFSCVRLCAILWTAAQQAPLPRDSLGKNTGVGCHFLLHTLYRRHKNTVPQKLIDRTSKENLNLCLIILFLTLSFYCPLNKHVECKYIQFHCIFHHTPILEFYKESESHLVVSDSLQPHGLYSPWDSPDQNTGVGSCSLLQGIFPTQRLNPGLPHCRWIL